MVSLGEFVFEIYDDDEPLGSGERIIRCRDCNHYDLIGITQGWWPICARGGNLTQVDPNGFCSWGEPKENR